MDLVTLAMAKAYSDSKGGYVKENKITVDLSGERVDLMGSGVPEYVKASDTPISMSSVARIVVIDYRGEETTYTKEHFNQQSGGGVEAIGINQSDFAAIISFFVDAGFGTGTFVFANSASVVSAFYTETIHPIDPKFIPGVVLPVVEIATPVDFENPNAQPLSVEDNAKLDAAFQTKVPFWVKCVDITGENTLYAQSEFLFSADTYLDIKAAYDVYGSKITFIISRSEEGNWSALLGFEG